MPIGTYTPPSWKTITQKFFQIYFILFFHFRCILLQTCHKKCFFISISILGRSGVNIIVNMLVFIKTSGVQTPPPPSNFQIYY